MASLRQKPRSPYWWACFYREDGSRTQRSTRLAATQPNRKAAQRIADDLEEAHKKKATEGQMRRILTDLNERLVGQPLASATLKDYAVQWLARKKGEVGGVTHLAYKSAVKGFVEETPAKANLGLQYVNPLAAPHGYLAAQERRRFRGCGPRHYWSRLRANVPTLHPH